jgi:hypothetical protein
MLDKERFHTAFKYLATATSLPLVEITREKKRVYFDAMQDIPTESVEGAAAQLAKSSQWFPKVSEWREAARSYTRTSNVKAFLPGEVAREWKHECDYCEDGGWCYEGGQTFHDVIMSGQTRPRMHRCVCRATNQTYQRHNRGFGSAA